MMFLPKKNFSAQETCRAIVEREVLKRGLRIYGWRQVPVVAPVIGEIANDSRPEIEQILGHQIFLELQVKTRPKWRSDAAMLERLGI
jgi:glutamate synthase domain-containing protein 1